MRNDRTKSLGGSDIAAIFGVSPWVTPYQLYLSKTNPIYQEQETNLAMEIGSELEKFILEKAKKELGYLTLNTNKDQLFKKHPKYDFLTGNIDAITLDSKTIIEAKTAASNKDWQDGIPEYYKLQIAHYANIWDVDTVIVALLTLGRGKEIKYFTYRRDLEYEKKIEEKAVKWWQDCILGGNLPDCTPNDTSTYSIDNIDIDSELVLSRTDEVTIKAMIKQNQEAKQKIEELENTIKKNNAYVANLMKEKEILLDNSGNKLATYKVITRKGGIDNKKLEKEHPKIYNQYLKEDICYRTVKFLNNKKGE